MVLAPVLRRERRIDRPKVSDLKRHANVLSLNGKSTAVDLYRHSLSRRALHKREKTKYGRQEKFA